MRDTAAHGHTSSSQTGLIYFRHVANPLDWVQAPDKQFAKVSRNVGLRVSLAKLPELKTNKLFFWAFE